MFNQEKMLFITSGILLGAMLCGLQISLKCFNQVMGNQEPARFATIEKISPFKYHFEVLGSDFEINIDRNLVKEVKSCRFR